MLARNRLFCGVPYFFWVRPDECCVDTLKPHPPPSLQTIISREWGYSVNIATTLWAGWPGFSSQHGQRRNFLLFAPASRPAVAPIRWVSGNLSSRVKRPDRESDLSPPSNGVFMECYLVIT